MGLIIVLVLWAIVGGAIGSVIGTNKGRGTEGFWLGFFLGVIGWIIVAVMSPSPEIHAQRTAEIITAITAQPNDLEEPGRACSWCAELIKPAARVCRYCGRDVEPASPAELVADPLELVRQEYPQPFNLALPHLRSLEPEPERPAAWIRELCKRIDAGSPAEAAAARIPLNWRGPESPTPPPTPVFRSNVPGAVGEYPTVSTEFPECYPLALSLMASREPVPSDPEAWLRELCKRIDAGSPAEAAAARISQNWS